MSEKEAKARIRINKLLEAAGWRFFPKGNSPANIQLEPKVEIKETYLESLGENFEKTKRGFVDFLLLDKRGFPIIVLEAKSEDKNPLIGKEQARKYARSQNCRFVVLSNGNLHYFWDLERGNPYIITSFPTPDSVITYQSVSPNPQRLMDENIREDYIALTQRPSYQSDAGWKNEAERPAYIEANKLRFLRPYQLKAIYRLQNAVREGHDRFLFEMATGMGKTLTAAAVIKLFLRTGNARRVLFLVDRRITLREILEKVFGFIPRFKSKDELLEEEFVKFVADYVPEPPSAIPAIKHYFKVYITSGRVRHIIDSREFTDLATNPAFSTGDLRAVPEKYRRLVPEYIKDYVPLNQFAV